MPTAATLATKASKSFQEGNMEEAADLFSQAMDILELKGVVNAGDKHATVSSRVPFLFEQVHDFGTARIKVAKW